MQPKPLARLLITIHTPTIISDLEIYRWEDLLRKGLGHEDGEQYLLQFATKGALVSPCDCTDYLLLDCAGTFTRSMCHTPPECAANCE